MSIINIDRGLSYTIPVDSIDLKYLNKYIRSPAIETIPLWTKTRLDGDAGYCHVQILTQNDEECFSEPTDTYMCHICNVNVPVTCSKEHNDSDQHKTIKNIYQKVLEKLSKQIDTNIINSDEKIDKEVYYCVPCSKIIKKENKDKHESSDFHAKSKKDTIIISEFYKIIKEVKSHTDDIVLIDERLDEDLEPVNTKSNIANNNNATTNKKVNNYLGNVHDDCTDVPAVANKLAIPGPSNNANKIQPPNADEAETFEEYSKAMIKKYKLKLNPPIMMFEEIRIESPNGNMVTVPREHFHSYKQVKNSIYCQMCKMWISQDTKPHDVTENHVRNIFKPINEKFARTIDTISSHCVPCNYVVLTNSTQHTLDHDHKKIVKDTRLEKVGQTFCEDCNIYIDTHNFAVHVISKKHLNGIMMQNSITPTENPNVFFCKFCNITVLRKGIKNHVVANMHLTKKNNNGATNLGSKNADSSVQVLTGGMETHVDGKSHKNKIIELNENDIKLKENKAQNSNGSSTSTSTIKNDSLASTSNNSSFSSATNITVVKIDEYDDLLEFTNDAKTEVRCKLCFVFMDFVERIIIDHMESKIHVEIATKQKMDIFKRFLIYPDDVKKVTCGICCVNIPNLDRNIIEHMEGRNHDIAETGLLQFHRITKESSGYTCECCDVHTTEFLKHINSKSHTTTFSKKYEIDKTEMRKYVYDEDNVDDFVARRHRELYRNLLKYNGIFKQNDTTYYCGLCEIKLGRISEIDHVLGDRHAFNLKIQELFKL